MIEISASPATPLQWYGSDILRTALGLRDSGFLMEAISIVPSNSAGFLLTRFDSIGNWSWSIAFSNEFPWSVSPWAVVEHSNGEIFSLAEQSGPDFWGTKLHRIGTNGLPSGEIHWYDTFAAMMPYEDGFLLGGTKSGNCSGVFFKKVSTNLVEEWERFVALPYLDCPVSRIAILTTSHDGGFLFAPRNRFRVVKVNAAGSLVWDLMFPGEPEQLHFILPTADGGWILAGNSDQRAGGWKTAPAYGSYDYWIVKLNGDGDVEWDRSYGGYGAESLQSILLSGDGGLLLAGTSLSDEPSGNKISAGAGNWFVKTGLRGLKVSEALVPFRGTQCSPLGLVPFGQGFKAFGTSCRNGMELCETWCTDISIIPRIIVSAKADHGCPYSIDSSHDLISWTPLVTGFAGDLEMVETINRPCKFWRIYEE